MKTFVFFIALLSTNILYGQKQGIKEIVSVKVCPLALLDIYSGMSPRIGLEYKLKKSLYLYNEIGTYISGPNSLLNNKGFISKMELKKYFNSDGINNGNYLSAEILFKHQSFGLTDTILTSPKYERAYSVTKNVSCFTIKFGEIKDLKHNFFFDYFIGLGLRYKLATSTLTKEENQNIKGEGDYRLNIAVGQAGDFFYPNIDFGIKVGYRLK